MAASTWASSEVATFTYAVPRWYVAAANPATSVTIAAADGHDDVESREADAGEETGQLLDGGEGLGILTVGDDADLGGDTGVETLDPAGVPDRLLCHDHRALGPGRHEAGHLMARPRPDQDGVRALGQVDGEGAHFLVTPLLRLGRSGVVGGAVVGVLAAWAVSLRLPGPRG